MLHFLNPKSRPENGQRMDPSLSDIMRVFRDNNASHPRYALNLPIPKKCQKDLGDMSPEFRGLLWALMIIDRNDNPDSAYEKDIESASVAGNQLIDRSYVLFGK